MAIDFKKSNIDFQVTKEQPKKENIITRIKSSIMGRGEKFAEATERMQTGKQSALETGLSLAGQTIGAGGDIVFEGLRAITPKKIREVLSSGVEKVAGLEPIKNTITAYSDWSKKNPRASSNLESGFNLVSTIPFLGGSKIASKVGAKAISPQAGRMASFFEGRLADQQIDDVLRVVKPELNKAEKIRLLTQGQAEKNWLGTIKSLPTDRDFQIAETLREVVSSKNNPIENIGNINSKIQEVSKTVDTGLKANNAIFNTSQLKKVLNDSKEASRVVFGSEKTIENTYDAVVDEFIRVMENKPKTVSGLWDGRKEFDNIMKQKFPKVFDNPATTDVARYNAINDVRRSANNYIESLLPDGDLYKTEMKKMSNMFDARENIASKAVNLLDANQVQKAIKWLRQNPVTAGLTGGIITAAGLTGLLTNPILLSSLILGGTYKIGKNVITSQIIKKALIDVLRATEKAGAGIESQSLRNIITEFDSFSRLPNKK